MFDFPVETSYLSKKTAQSFGLPLGPKSDGCSFQPVSIKETDEQVDISLFLDGSEKETIITYDKKQLTDRQEVFIAWVYILLAQGDDREKYKDNATKYLSEALKNDWGGKKPREERWAFPYYLASKHNLDTGRLRDIRVSLFNFLNTDPPLFVDFYKELLRREKNPVRELAIAKVASKHYPTESWFIRVVAEDLFKRKKYDECIEYFQSIREGFKEDIEEWKELESRTTLIECYLKKQKYTEALEELKTPITSGFFNENYTSFLKGYVLYHQKSFEEASEEFEKSIVEDYTDTSVSIVSSYYLIHCYLALKSPEKASELIQAIELREGEYEMIGLSLSYEADAIEIISNAIKSRSLDEKVIAKLKGLLAYLLQRDIPSADEAPRPRPLTKKEKRDANRAIELVKEALVLWPQEAFFNALLSKLLYAIGDPDGAMDYKIKSLTKDIGYNGIYTEITLAECSEEYIENYVERIKKIFSDMGAGYGYYLENYAFDSDIGILWEKKQYKQVSDLYKQVKPSIKDFGKIGEISEYINGGSLFEIAYSLKESGDIEEARWVYEKHAELNGENSAVLNNLAIIYEEKNDLKKAKTLIKKAKDIDPADEVVARNFSRLCGGKSDSNPKTSDLSKKQIQKEELIFDPKTGEIVFGKKKCGLPIGSNQYQLCKTLFELPIGEWLQEIDVIEKFYRGKDSQRGFYDAIRLSNKKIEEKLKIKKLLEYGASRVRIRAELLG